jgi:hypothetical protein
MKRIVLGSLVSLIPFAFGCGEQDPRVEIDPPAPTLSTMGFALEEGEAFEHQKLAISGIWTAADGSSYFAVNENGAANLAGIGKELAVNGVEGFRPVQLSLGISKRFETVQRGQLRLVKYDSAWSARIYLCEENAVLDECLSALAGTEPGAFLKQLPPGE